MINYIIADDDEMQLDYLLNLLASVEGINCVGSSSNAMEALDLIALHQPHMLILDIEMPKLTGVQIAQSLASPPLIIFISSHSGYAAQAFDIDAFDYVVKPVAPERLYRAINKAKTFLKSKATDESKELFPQASENVFFVKENNLFIKIVCNEVSHIESQGNFCQIHKTDGTKLLVLANLAKMEERIPASCFLRISRSMIVNKKFVEAVNNEILILNGHEFSVGRTHAKKVIDEIIGEKLIRR